MISLIFAVGLNGELGYKNKMLWHLKYAYRLYATIVKAEFTYADTYYNFSTDKYKLILSQEYFEDGYNDYSYDFYIYQKII